MGVHSPLRISLEGHMQTVAVADLVAAVRRQQLPLSALGWAPPPSDGRSAAVCGVHPGAGASTVAVALAEATADAAGSVTVVDFAADKAIGASEAIEVRANLALRGWTGGRRGHVRIVRPSGGSTDADDIPGRLIIDVCGDGPPSDVDVMVCRATVPSVRRAEHVLSQRSARAVAVVGATKWPAAVRLSLGVHLRDLDSARRVVFFPRDEGLEVNGLSADPLPASTIRAARGLLDLLDRQQGSGESGDRS